MLIAERIGDTVEMVNNIYGQLYLNRHEEVADRLEQLVSANIIEAENHLYFIIYYIFEINSRKSTFLMSILMIY